MNRSPAVQAMVYSIANLALPVNDQIVSMDWYIGNAIKVITLTPYMVLPLFATRFAEYAGGIRVSFI